jgi:hypothetical protein
VVGSGVLRGLMTTDAEILVPLLLQSGHQALNLKHPQPTKRRARGRNQCGGGQ